MFSEDATVAFLDCLDGPSPADLDAIDREWPLIAADLDLTDVQIDVLTTDTPPTDLDWRRLRRAERRVLHTLTDLLNLASADEQSTVVLGRAA